MPWTEDKARFSKAWSRMKGSPFMRAGAAEAGSTLGVGPRGLFHRNTLKAGKLGVAGRLLGPAFMGLSIHHGYQEGGAIGAAKAGIRTGAEFFAFGVAQHAAGALLGSAATPVAVGAAIVGGVGFGTYKALEHGNEKMRRIRKLEMGSPVIDPHGIGATMRQRSLRALMQSQVNGRSAMGQEAALMHMPMMR